MVTENVLGIESPRLSVLIRKDAVKDRVQHERAPCVIVLAFRLTASVVLRSADRHDTVLNVGPLKAQRFARSHSGTKEPPPQVDIPFILKVVHEPSRLIRLQDLFADLRSVLRHPQKREREVHDLRALAILREVHNYTADIGKCFLRQFGAVLLPCAEEDRLKVLERQRR